MSVGRSLNILSMQLTHLEAATTEVETQLLTRTSKDDLLVGRLLERLERIGREIESLTRSRKRAGAMEVHRRFVLGRPAGDRAFAVRDALRAHDTQFATLDARIERIQQRCARLVRQAGDPTTTDVLNWAFDMLGVSEQQLMQSVVEPSAPQQEVFRPKPGASILVPLAVILLLSSKIRSALANRDDA